MTSSHIDKIKNAETKIKALFDAKELKGTIHLGVGQEAIDCGVIDGCIQSGYTPFVLGNHRSHGQYLYFSEEENLIKELKEYKGQHLYIPGKMLTTGIQGALTAFAVGLAMAFDESRRVLCFVGDGTLGQGLFYESLGLASMFGPPVTFIIVDNDYSMSKTVLKVHPLYLAEYYGLPYTLISEGWIYEKVLFSVKVHYDNFGGAGIIHIKNKRLCGHSCSDTQMYRPKEELTSEFKEKYESRTE
jgi:TPP-dependent pyruvate/acetoin dehydrogenase alpha subunit